MTLPPYSSWKLACVMAVTRMSPTSDVACAAPDVADGCGVGVCAGDAAVAGAFWFCAGGGAQASIRNAAEVKMNDATILMCPLPKCSPFCSGLARQGTTKRGGPPPARLYHCLPSGS